MNVVAGQVSTRLVLDSAEYTKRLQMAANYTKDFAKTASTSTSSVGRDFRNLARSVIGVTAVFQSVRKVVKEGLGFNAFVQEQTAAFSVMLKSVDAAKAKVGELYKFAVESPLTFKETVGASKQLLAYGFAADSLVANMKMLGTVAKATGHSLDDISYVYGTLKSQGRAYSRDLMQFAMRGIPIYEELSKVMGVPLDRLKKLTEEGKVGFEEVELAFQNMTNEGGRFAGMMDEYMKTVRGQLSMLGDVAEQSAGQLMSGVSEQLVPIIKEVTRALQDNQETLKVMGQAMGLLFVGAVEGAMKFVHLLKIMSPILVTIGAYLLATAIPGIIVGIQAITAEVVTFAAAFMATPFGPIMLALGAAALAASWLWDFLNQKIKESEDATRAASKALEVYNNQSELMDEKRWRRGRSTAALTPPTKEMFDYMDKLRAEYAKFLAEKRRDEEYIADAVVNYERMVRIEEAKKLFGEGSPLFTEAKRYIDAMSDYEAKALRDKQSKAWKDALQEYKDRYDKIIAQQQVADFTNIYAVAELEFAEQKKLIAEKFKGNKAYRDQALEIARKLHEITMDNIRKEKAERDRATFDETLSSRVSMLGAPMQTAMSLDLSSFEAINRQMGDIFTAVSDIQAQVLVQEQKRLQALEMDWAPEVKAATAELLILDSLLKQYGASVNVLIAASDILSAALQRAADLAEYNVMTGGDPEYWDNLKVNAVNQMKSGDVEGSLASTAQGALQGTEVGTMMAGGDPLTMLILKLAEFLLSLENVQKVLNPIGTAIAAMGKIIGPINNVAFQGFASLLEDTGYVLGQMLAPVLNMVALGLQMIAGIIKTAVLPAFAVLGAMFAWFNDKVIVPVGNAIIDSFNAIIITLNELPFVSIQLLDTLATTEQAFEDLADTAKMNSLTDALDTTITYLMDALNELVDAQIQSARDLYEVGAISGAQYNQMVEDANSQRIDTDLQLVSLADQQLAALGSTGAIATRLGQLLDAQKQITDTELAAAEVIAILTALGIKLPEESGGGGTTPSSSSSSSSSSSVHQSDGLTNPPMPVATQIAKLQAQLKAMIDNMPDFYNSDNPRTAAHAIQEYNRKLNVIRNDIRELGGVPMYAAGSTTIPYDQLAVVHSGETIIPKTFAEGIRSGEMVLSGNNTSTAGSSDVYVTVNVSGSVATENDLAASIAKNIYTQRRRGILTV